MRIRFFTRAPTPEKLFSALRAGGHIIDIGDAAAFGELPEDTRALIDESALPEFSGRAEQLRGRRAAALIRTAQVAPRDLLPSLHRVIATSAATAERLADVGQDRIRVITAGVDPAPRSPGSGGSGCHLLIVAPFAAGGALLLGALARLFDLDWSLTIVAEPDPAFAELPAALGIAARVHRADADASETLWRQADLFVLARAWEGEPPGTIGEALRRGVPVIVTAAGSEAAVVPPQAGLVCPPDDRDQLSRSLRRLIFDPALRRAYANAAYAAGAALPDWPAQAALLVTALE